MAVINKVDLVSDKQLEQVIAAVRKVNPICRLITCVSGAIDLSMLNEDLTSLKWASCKASLNTEDNKPKTISLECTSSVPREKLMTFLQCVQSDCYRIKGFFHVENIWYQIDVVEKLIDFKPCPPRTLSQLVFLSKIGPQIIRNIDNAWKENVALPMKLKN